MTFFSYNVTVAETMHHVQRMIQEGGAQAVKVEGGKSIATHVAAIVAAGVPVMGHLGLTPQSIHKLGGHRVCGRTTDEREWIMDDAKILQDAGCFSLVLEMVPASLAQEITAKLSIPTIGIGACVHCDGQILVLHDLLGFDDTFQPRFLKKYAQLDQTIKHALNAYDQEVKQGVFPSTEQSF